MVNDGWMPKLKNYPHFDKPLPIQEIVNIVSNPGRVAKNAFFPFIQYEKKQRKFGRKIKTRIIRYASRRDAYIYGYYRHLLQKYYEKKIHKLNIQDCPIAYRKIPNEENVRSNKCNINFAKTAFNEVALRRECYAIAIDIRSFFETIDHDKLHAALLKLMEVAELPADYAAVYKAMTKYSFINRDACYERLGYFEGEKASKQYNQKKKRVPMQLCSPLDFRSKICGKDKEYSKLIERNHNCFGVPQGAPLSDLFANIYLMEFDYQMNELAKKMGGRYMRYSDDIFFVCPNDENLLNDIMSTIDALIKDEKLEINHDKNQITQFYMKKGEQKYEPFHPQRKGSLKKMEYLGFSFDGKYVLLKDKTLSNFYRKLTFDMRREARKLVNRFPGEAPGDVLAKTNFSKLCQKYGKINNFITAPGCYEDWNFWTYAKRSSGIMGEMGIKILPQLKRRKKRIMHTLKVEIEKQIKATKK